MSEAVVQVKHIRLAVFQRPFLQQHNAITQPWSDNGSAIDDLHFDPSAVANVVCPIVRHVQFQCPIAIDVCQSHRGASECSFRPGGLSKVCELACAVVPEAEDTVP